MQILLSFFRILLNFRKYIDFAVLRRNLLNELTGIQFSNYVQGNIACKLHDFPCLHLVINLLITKGLFYHTFHIHLSASLSYIIRSNYGIFKLEKLWVCVCVCGVCVCVYVLSHVRLFAVLWNVACQAPLFMGSPGQEYWSGLPFRLSNSQICSVCTSQNKFSFFHLWKLLLKKNPAYQ